MSATNDLIDIKGVCAKIGGTARPLHPSTVRRMVRQGRLPRPLKFGGRVARWREGEIDALLQRLAAERDRPTTTEIQQLRYSLPDPQVLQRLDREVK